MPSHGGHARRSGGGGQVRGRRRRESRDAAEDSPTRATFASMSSPERYFGGISARESSRAAGSRVGARPASPLARPGKEGDAGVAPPDRRAVPAGSRSLRSTVRDDNARSDADSHAHRRTRRHSSRGTGASPVRLAAVAALVGSERAAGRGECMGGAPMPRRRRVARRKWISHRWEDTLRSAGLVVVLPMRAPAAPVPPAAGGT